jgi:hypothetical protein
VDAVTAVCGGAVLACGLFLWVTRSGRSRVVGVPDGQNTGGVVPTAQSADPFASVNRPPPPRRAPRYLIADGRNKFEMSSSEYQADLRAHDPNKANTDYPPSFGVYRDFYHTEEWRLLKGDFRSEAMAHDRGLWTCWSDLSG